MSFSRSVRWMISSPRRNSPRAMWNRNGPNRTNSAAGERRRLRALEDVGDAQRQFPRLERLCHIIVGADLEAGNPALRFGARGEHQDRHLRGPAQRSRKIKAGFPGHHDIEDQEIEGKAVELGAGVGGVVRGGDAVAFAPQIARQQVADAAVVVDHQEMRGVVGKRCAGKLHRLPSLLSCKIHRWCVSAAAPSRDRRPSISRSTPLSLPADRAWRSESGAPFVVAWCPSLGERAADPRILQGRRAEAPAPRPWA